MNATQANPVEIVQRAMMAHQGGRLAEAEDLYKAALAINPDQFDALHFLGLLNAQKGNLGEADRLISRSLTINSQKAEAFANYARVLRDLGRNEKAVEICDRALSLNPRFVDAYVLRGNALRELRRYEESLSSIDKALALHPANPLALLSRADTLGQLGRYDDALSSYDRLIAAHQNFAEALNNRGLLLVALKRFEEALASLDRAIATSPNYSDAHCSRGVVLARTGRLEEALQSQDQALALRPNSIGALSNRGTVLLDLGRSKEAIVAYKRALEIQPDVNIHSNLIFALNFDPESGMRDQQAERARWQESHGQPFAAAARPHGNNRDLDRRLRIGYVSSHFCHQAATYAFGGVIGSHDPEQFEVTCYSDTVQEDDVTNLLRARAHNWRNTAALSDDELAEMVRTDQIDILIDCVGHMSGNRLLAFARKPAPVQVTAWGEPTGTGLKAMNYLLADPVLVPAAERALLAEQVVDLPNFLGYWVPDELPDVSELPAIARGYVTFGSFNRFAKIQESVLRCWAAILRELPRSRLVIKGFQAVVDSGQRGRIDAVLSSEGVGADRVDLVGQTDRVGHFAAYRDVDIALDPFPHGGGMTTLDALWMGVPVVARRGSTISSRLAEATLTNLGLAGFIAPDEATYVRLAIAKATDLAAIAQLRANLRGLIASSAIGDAGRYTRAVETAFRAMWHRWCKDQIGSPKLG